MLYYLDTIRGETMHKFTVENLEQITPSTILLTLRINDGEPAFGYHSGQYAAIGFYKGGRPTPMRCFSIVTSPTQPGILQFSMRARGHFTRGLANLKQGDKVKVAGPYGGFVMTNPRDLETLFLAGGIGITPFMSMVRFAASEKLQNNIKLLYSCQSQDDIPFFEELQQLQAENPRFKVAYFIGDGPTDKLGDAVVYTGRITPEAIDTLTDNVYTDKSFFICGPPPFMNGLRKTIHSKGAPLGSVVTEAFSQGANRQTGKVKSWPFSMYVMGAVGMGVASFTIMVTDLLKTIPSSASLHATNNGSASAGAANKRQQNLDQLVNSFASVANTAPVEASVLALNQSQASSTPQATTPQSSGSTTPSTTYTAAPAPMPTPAPAPTPAPPPAPVCTTSPSGVRTCV
ncbi:MAG: FAD-dependent oxidoreductase [Candidatus Saccharimonadales bacterium]